MLRRRRKQLNELITVKIEPKGWVDHFASHQDNENNNNTKGESKEYGTDEHMQTLDLNINYTLETICSQ